MKTRKTLILILIVLLLGTTGAFAAKGSGLALGVEGALSFGGVGGMPMGAMILLHVPQMPIMWGIGIDNALDIAVTGDYWFWHSNIGSIFSMYAGIGGYLTLSTGPFDLGVGARIPIGLQAWPFGQNLEIFLEVTPALGVSFIPTGFNWHVQSALGLRYWF
jgi:hypothetical protein